ncbi:hypothetical protein MM213_18140 [Belliella sp. R4-6]|uniref:Lipoprotein n=1 Tax=Belliella alkalica TaxID=1730871 RepID=A0ABS9VG58_9BACT|nr:hypothetical protein [Belliella alkalica]MCH7415426.1 hypothetical protein [Belliella alkalica]
MIKKHYWLLAFSLCLLFGCNLRQKEEDSINTLDKSNWVCKEITKDEICLPKDWIPIEQDNAYFFAYLDNNDKQTYFAILKYDVLKDNVNAKAYLNEMVDLLVNSDDEELFEGYTLNELKFIDKTSFYGEYYTQINGHQYFTYSMVIEYNKHLYEIALKVPRSKEEYYTTIFQKIITNFKIENKTLFNINDEILEERLFNLHD